MIGKTVKVIVDRPLGSLHPKYKNMQYPINYGYIEGVIGGDKEEQDAYLPKYFSKDSKLNHFLIRS